MSRLALQALAVGRDGFRVGPFTASVEAGMVLALLGPNGGGKTTLLRTLSGELRPLAGAFIGPDAKTPALMPAPGEVEAGFEAGHMVALGRAGRGAQLWGLDRSDREAAVEALEALGIADLAARPFDRLSSGQRQLVMLARLRVQEAGLCLLDEPTALLDPGQAAKVQAAIRGLADDGRVVVVATHDIDAALTADRVLTVGPEIAFGPTDAVVTPERLARLYRLGVTAHPQQ